MPMPVPVPMPMPLRLSRIAIGRAGQRRMNRDPGAHAYHDEEIINTGFPERKEDRC